MKKQLVTRQFRNTRCAPGLISRHTPNGVPIEPVERQIYLIHGQKVMLDRDLATLYGVETRVLNQAVRRNLERFPGDFMFRLNAKESLDMRSQIVIASSNGGAQPPASQKRNLRHLPFVFTEQGIAMLSSVLRSPRAILVNVEIMRAFVRLRQMLASNVELTRKLIALERKYDRRFRIVFDAIRELMADSKPEPAVARREIGFHTIATRPENRQRPRAQIRTP